MVLISLKCLALSNRQFKDNQLLTQKEANLWETNDFGYFDKRLIRGLIVIENGVFG